MQKCTAPRYVLTDGVDARLCAQLQSLFHAGAQHSLSLQVCDIPNALSQCLAGLAACTRTHRAHTKDAVGAADGAACSDASGSSVSTCSAGTRAETLWVRACCALLERVSPVARSGSLLLQA